jgi:RNA polymerase sigma-70 factor (ECF subfamily)
MQVEDAPDQLLTLHWRLLAGDRIASEEVFTLLLSSLTRQVSRQFPTTDEQAIWDGVSDALLDYCARPQQFDERRGVPLDRFLGQAAWRNVANWHRGEKRRKAREERAGQENLVLAVELDPTAGNLLQKEETARQQHQQEQLMRVLQDPKDQQILGLRRQGERRTKAFAEVLGITHLPIEVQRREVKRNKDRIDKILRRHIGGSL